MQERFQWSAGISVLGVLLLILWLLVFSRFRWAVRLKVLAAVLLPLVMGALLFEFRGVTGDLVPILEWRWSGLDDSRIEGADAEAKLEDLQDYPQFLGDNRDGVVDDFAVVDDWATSPPRLLWRQPIGEGWSAFAVSGPRAVTQEQDGAYEQVVAYDVFTGRKLWSHGDQVRFDNPISGVGPRATPTIADGRVYSMGSTGILNALDLQTGRQIWQRNVLDENDSAHPTWGYSGSPLVLGDRVIVASGGPGRALVAYDRDNGELLWGGGSDSCGFSSPQLRALAGREQILIFNKATVAGHSPKDGRLLWEYRWSSAQPNVSQPLVVAENRLLVSSGYGVGSKLLALEQAEDGTISPRLLWETPRMKAKFTNLVMHGGYVYGLDDGRMACLDPATGELCWKSGRYGHGQIILAGNRLLIQAENGEVVWLEPSPAGLRELSRFPALDDKTWNPPALAGRYLLVRNHLEAACYELPTASE